MNDSKREPILEISNLTVKYPVGPVVLRELQLTVARGEGVGIHGLSGCGKTTLARVIPALLPPRCEITGSIVFDGQDVFRMNAMSLRALRGAHVASLFQEPSLSLSPHIRVGSQIAEVMAQHRALSRTESAEASMDVLEPLFGRESARIALAYPHELSGGQRQRVALARAVCCAPDLIVADEPVASLDSIGQREVLGLLAGYRERTGMSMLLISHNRAAMRRSSSRILELREGRLEPS